MTLAAWQAAAEQAQAEQRRPQDSPSLDDRLGINPEPESLSWEWEADSSTVQRRTRLILRFLAIAALLILVLLGLRGLIIPLRPQPAPPQTTHTDIDTQQAGAAAARFITAALSDPGQDDTDQENRTTTMALDAAQGWKLPDAIAGTLVISATPAGITEQHGSSAMALTNAQLRPSDPTAAADPTKRTGWVTFATPVAEMGGRVVVTGPPTLTAIPTPGTVTTASEGAQPATDATITAATTDTVRAVMTAMTGDGSALAQVLAPGASVAPLGDGMSLSKLNWWRVHAGKGKTRTGTANVTWALPTGAQLTQTYDVTLTALTTATGKTAWRVTAVAPAVPTATTEGDLTNS